MQLIYYQTIQKSTNNTLIFHYRQRRDKAISIVDNIYIFLYHATDTTKFQ